MIRQLSALTASLAALFITAPALAGNVAKCEVVALLTVEDESGGSASYRYYFPASDFLSGVYDPEVELSKTQDGHPIEGITCERNDLMPDEEDYAILATGIPMVLSQDFDQPDTDVLTLFFAGDQFKYRYLSETEIDGEFEADLNALLADFSGRDHGLGVSATGEEDLTEEDVSETESYDEPVFETVAVEPVLTEADVSETVIETMTVTKSFQESADIVASEPILDLPVGSIIPGDTEDTEATEDISSVSDLYFDPETGQIVEMKPDSD